MFVIGLWEEFGKLTNWAGESIEGCKQIGDLGWSSEENSANRNADSKGQAQHVSFGNLNALGREIMLHYGEEIVYTFLMSWDFSES